MLQRQILEIFDRGGADDAELYTEQPYSRCIAVVEEMTGGKAAAMAAVKHLG